MDGMQRVLVGAAALAIAGIATGACANVTISSRPTQNMTCSGGVCTPTAKKAVLNVSDLTSMLAAGNVKVASGSQAQDIEIDAALNWTSAHRLTLDVYQSITFNKPVVVAGTGALTITTNNGGTGGDFRFTGKGHIEFWDLSSSLIINGHSYGLVHKLKQLALAVRRDGNGYYALAKSVSAKNHLYSASPIGNNGFGGIFEGLGNTISYLTINNLGARTVGLFAQLDSNGLAAAAIRDIKLTFVNIKGGNADQGVGALLGVNHGMLVANSSAAGQITANWDAGGLVAFNDRGTVKNSSADVAITSTNSGSIVGGLVGLSKGYESNFGMVKESYATGSVSGGDGSVVGGLVGQNLGANISNSYASGGVNGGTNSFAGGLVGSTANDPQEQSNSIISDVYSTGAVTGGSGAIIGGLIGEDLAQTGTTNSYWDMDTSGISDPAHGAGNIANDPGITGLTTEQFKSGLPAGFDPSIWKEKANINSAYPYLIDLPPD